MNAEVPAGRQRPGKKKRPIVSYRRQYRQMSSGSTCGTTAAALRQPLRPYSFSRRREIIASRVVVGFSGRINSSQRKNEGRTKIPLRFPNRTLIKEGVGVGGLRL